MAAKQPTKQPTIYQHKDWLPCILLWSAKWRDPESGKIGCAYYSTNGVDNDEHVVTNSDGKKFKLYRVFFNDRDTDVPCLCVPGGKAVLQVFPKRAYMNINKSYKGLPYMYEDKYKTLVADGHMIEIASLPTGATLD